MQLHVVRGHRGTEAQEDKGTGALRTGCKDWMQVRMKTIRQISALGVFSRMNTHRKLRAWQLCRELAVEVYAATGGYGRREFAHALSIALGSLAEVDTLLQIALDIGVLKPGLHGQLDALRDEASRATFGLQRTIRR